MENEISLSSEFIKRLIYVIEDSVGLIDSEWPGHYSKFDQLENVLKRRLEGDTRPELEILLEVQS